MHIYMHMHVYGLFKFSKVSSIFFLLLFYHFSITSKLCYLEDLSHSSTQVLKDSNAQRIFM
jgi:hypothetical protein